MTASRPADRRSGRAAAATAAAGTGRCSSSATQIRATPRRADRSAAVRSRRRRRHPALLVGHDRVPQGRDAHPPEPRCQPRPVRRGQRLPARRRRARDIPMFHIYGLNGLMNAFLAHGVPFVTLPRFELDRPGADPGSSGDALLRGATDHARARSPPARGRLRRVIAAQHRLRRGAARRRAGQRGRRAHRLQVYQAFGMTELSPMSHTTILPDISPVRAAWQHPTPSLDRRRRGPSARCRRGRASSWCAARR